MKDQNAKYHAKCLTLIANFSPQQLGPEMTGAHYIQNYIKSCKSHDLTKRYESEKALRLMLGLYLANADSAETKSNPLILSNQVIALLQNKEQVTLVSHHFTPTKKNSWLNLDFFQGLKPDLSGFLKKS